MGQNKERNNRFVIFVSAVVLGIVFLLLLILDINNTIDKSLGVYNDNQKTLANVLMKTSVVQAQNDSSELKDKIIASINDDFPTSSSTYCILAKNDDIIFLKDDNTSSTLMDEKLSDYFDGNNIASRDNQKYIISTSETQYSGNDYTFVICTRQNYIIKQINFNELRLHCLGYFVIYGVILLIIIILLFYKSRSDQTRKKTLSEEAKYNRMIIEKLGNDKNKNYVNSDREGVYSFYSRSIVDEVIVCMSEEEKKNCIEIDIIIENLKIEHFILITAILGRIKEGNSLACYWEENQFKVLLLDSDKKDVQEFIDIFMSKYRTDSEEKVEELKIIASRFGRQIMEYSQYKYNFYLNASHSIYIDGNKGERHPHTWQISLYVVNSKDTFMMFNEVEKLIEDYLGQYQEKYMNECAPFDTMNPTLENIAQYFMEELQKHLNPLNWVIFTMEISETPSRSYIISNVENNIISDVEKRNIAEKILDKTRKNKQ